MKTPVNAFKKALAEKRTQYGLWVSLMGPLNTEICAAAGFDWLLLDAEHTPNDPANVLQQAQVIAAYPGVSAVARVPMGHGYVGQALIKQYLDVGVQTLLVPMVDTAQQARELVRCMRYPPEGIRGMGAALARASRWNQVDDYLNQANDQMCLLVQAETVTAVKNLKAIAQTEGVDGVFFGPADLSASMGHRGQPGHPEVQKVILDGIATVRAAGKAAGILATDPALAQQYLNAGALFVAVGVDTTLLVKAASGLVQRFRAGAAKGPASPSGGY